MYTIREKGFEYSPLEEIYIRDENILLYGYFQSALYFDEFKTQIFKMIKIPLCIIAFIESLFPNA